MADFVQTLLKLFHKKRRSIYKLADLVTMLNVTKMQHKTGIHGRFSSYDPCKSSFLHMNSGAVQKTEFDLDHRLLDLHICYLAILAEPGRRR